MGKKSASKIDKPKNTEKVKSTDKPESTEEEDKSKEEQKSTKKSGNEIDQIFSGKKRKKSEQGKKNNEKPTEDADKETKTLKKKKNKKKKSNVDDNPFADAPSQSRKKTEDGFTIYTEDELGINSKDAGGTPLCPFDCSCCF